MWKCLPLVFAPRQSLKASQFSEGELSLLLCRSLLSLMSPNALRNCICNGLLDDSVVQSSLETFALERRRKPRADIFGHSWWHCIAILSSERPEVCSAFRFCICKPLISPPEVKNMSFFNHTGKRRHGYLSTLQNCKTV